MEGGPSGAGLGKASMGSRQDQVRHPTTCPSPTRLDQDKSHLAPRGLLLTPAASLQEGRPGPHLSLAQLFPPACTPT